MRQITNKIARRDKFIIITREFNTPLSVIDKSNRQKINGDIIDLNNTINQFYIIKMYRIFHSTITEYTFFSCTSEKCTMITLSYKTQFNYNDLTKIVDVCHLISYKPHPSFFFICTSEKI